MEHGQKKCRSKKEAEQFALFEQYLETEAKVASPKTRQDYLSAVSSALTKKLMADGVICEPLLTLTDREQLTGAAVWLNANKKSLLNVHRTALKKYLLFRGVDPDNSKIVPSPLPERELQVPPYKIRLSFLVKSFFWNYKKPGKVQYTLLNILSGLPEYLIKDDCLRERVESFSDIRWRILQRIEQSPDTLTTELVKLAKHYSSDLETACQHIVTDCMAYALDLLQDARELHVPYDNCLMARLEELQNACWQKDPDQCGHKLLALFRTVLLDCDPASRDYPPGQDALKDERLWKNSLFRSWLAGLNDKAVLFLLSVPFPEQKDSRSALAAALLYHSIRLAEVTVGTPDAGTWMETAVTLCGQYWEDLYPALKKPPVPSFPKIPEPLLLGGVNGSIYYAWLRRKQAELLLCTPADGKTRGMILVIRARDALRKSSAVIRNRLEDNHELLEALEDMKPFERARQMLAENSTLTAECCKRLALLEEEQTCLTDVLEMYIRPCRELLSAANPRPETFDSVCQDCFSVFFDGDSAFVRRLRLQPGTDCREYQEEQRLWQEAFGLKSVAAPAVHLPLEEDLLRDQKHFKPVYSGVFDSVLGKTPQQQKSVELGLFQLLGSSQTSILQMNQVVDNLTMLRLFHVPGYQAACRSGFVTLSCYGEVHSPRIYLEKNLQNPNFIFSCSNAFQLPQGLTGKKLEDAIKNGARGVMLRYLNGQAALSDFPLDCDRAEMEFLAESWKIAFDCFQHSDLRRYHQNPAYRYPPSKRTPPYAQGMLSQVVQERLQALVRDAEQPGSTKNLERLRAVQSYYQEQLGSKADRSSYVSAADQMLQDAEDHVWEDLREIINQCYFLYNGALCCDHILLTASDPDFILTPSENGPEVTYQKNTRSPTAEYVYRQAWKPGTLEHIGWPDLCDIALLSRELDLKSRGQSPEQRLAQKERETGMGYCLKNKEFLLMDYIVKLSTEERVHVCPPEPQDDVRFMEMEGT